MKIFGWQWGTFFFVFTINTMQNNLHDKGGEIITDEEEVWNILFITQPNEGVPQSLTGVENISIERPTS